MADKNTNPQPNEPKVDDKAPTNIQEPTNQPQPAPAPKNEPVNVTEVLEKVTEQDLLSNKKVQALIQNARQQEKDKLYVTIQKKDEKIEELENTITDLKQEVERKENELMEDEKVLLDKINELTEQQKELMEKIKAEEEKAKKAELENYRTQKIASANGEIVEELVTGNTKEEIDASFEKAVAKFKEIASKFEEKKKEETAPKKENTPKTTNPPISHGGGEIDISSVKNMTMEEYRQYREKILRNVRN